MTGATTNAETTNAAELAGDLRIAQTRTMSGPNAAHRGPVVVAELRAGALAAVAPEAVPALAERLRDALPDLDVGAALRSWGDALLRVALELQRLAGSPPVDGRVVAGARGDERWSVAVGFDDETLAREAVHLGARVLRDCLRGDDAEVPDVVAELSREYERARPDAPTRAMIAAARRRGIPVRRDPDDGVVQLGLGACQRRLDGTLTDAASALGARAAGDWRRTRAALARAELRVADERGDAGDAPAGAVAHRVAVVGRRVVACVARTRAADGVETTVDRADAMHPRNRAMCELAAGAVGLAVAELRVLTPDVAVPFDENGAVIVDVSAEPDPAPYAFPDRGAPRDVPGAILDVLFPVGAEHSVPVLAVTGTNGKTTTTRLLAHLFRSAGRTVGFTTTDGVYVREQRVLEGDLTGPFAANLVLSHPDVDVAVLETARGGILRSGLGFDACDVGVVLNVTADHLGIGGVDTLEQLADVKAVVAGAVKPGGHTVLNADDPLVLAMRERTVGTVVLFSMRGPGENEAVEAQLARGGIVARLERRRDDEVLVIREGQRRAVLATAREIPLTFGGAARFQIQNALAASAAAYAQGLPAERIRAGLLDFVPSPSHTPGRLNVFETSRGRLIIDYAHNAAAIAGLVAFVAGMPATERILVLSVPGDRRDADIRGSGALAAPMDYVIFKEYAQYRRGRAAGESARLLTEGLLATGFPADRVATFAEERDALAHALARMRPGCVLAIVADAPNVIEQFRPYLAEADLPAG